MTIKPLANRDWQLFQSWAATEGWRISFLEQHLFQNQWRPYFHVLWKQGRRCGFVSAVIYKTSAWIGNLIVDPQLRGQGYGSQLFEFALTRIRRHPQMEKIWLTASGQGASLYRKHGFIAVDKVSRWQAEGRADKPQARNVEVEKLLETDHYCWGESRAPLLKLLADDACSLSSTGNLALLQAGMDFWQLGPWLTDAPSPLAYKKILGQSQLMTPKAKQLVADVLESSGAPLMLQQTGFRCLGSNLLMCLCAEPVRLKGVIALASLGSIG
jgi:ribosomal protein S18 acetylase RimI-like enzyme